MGISPLRGFVYFVALPTPLLLRLVSVALVGRFGSNLDGKCAHLVVMWNTVGYLLNWFLHLSSVTLFERAPARCLRLLFVESSLGSLSLLVLHHHVLQLVSCWRAFVHFWDLDFRSQ